MNALVEGMSNVEIKCIVMFEMPRSLSYEALQATENVSLLFSNISWVLWKCKIVFFSLNPNGIEVYKIRATNNKLALKDLYRKDLITAPSATERNMCGTPWRE